MGSNVKECYGWGIIGCGWLGRAFARRMSEKGERVWGSTQSEHNFPAIAETGALPIRCNFDGKSPPQSACPPCRRLLVAVSPRVDVQSLAIAVQSALQDQTRWVVMISSTSVYPTEPGRYSEEDAVDRISPHSGVRILHMEQSMTRYNTTVLRAGGLIGPGRPLFRPSAPQGAPDKPLVVIHQEDVIRAIVHATEQKLEGPANLVCPVSRTRSECLGPAPPTEPSAANRSISVGRLLDSGFQFHHPDPAAMPHLHP